MVLLEDSDAHLDEARGAIPGALVTSYTELLAEGRATTAEIADDIERTIAGTGEDSVATISYTSGTTGNPKGIMLTHLNYFANCTDAVEMFNVPYDFSTLVILPCDHSFAESSSPSSMHAEAGSEF